MFLSSKVRFFDFHCLFGAHSPATPAPPAVHLLFCAVLSLHLNPKALFSQIAFLFSCIPWVFFRRSSSVSPSFDSLLEGCSSAILNISAVRAGLAPRAPAFSRLMMHRVFCSRISATYSSIPHTLHCQNFPCCNFEPFSLPIPARLTDFAVGFRPTSYAHPRALLLVPSQPGTLLAAIAPIVGVIRRRLATFAPFSGVTAAAHLRCGNAQNFIQRLRGNAQGGTPEQLALHSLWATCDTTMPKPAVETEVPNTSLEPKWLRTLS